MKKWKKILCVGLAFILAVGLCACGKAGDGGSGGKKGTSADPSLAKQYVYSMQEFDLSAFQGKSDDTYIQSAMEMDGRLYLIMQVYNWEKDDSQSYKLMSMNTDGSDVTVCDLQKSADEGTGDAADRAGAAAKAPDGAEEQDRPNVYENIWLGSFQISKNGKVYGTKNHSREDYSDPDKIVNEREFYVCCWDMSGQMLWERVMENLQTDESFSYVNGIVGQEDGSAILLIAGDKSGRITVDEQGKMSEIQPMEGFGDLVERMSSWTIMSDGKILMTYYDAEWKNMYVTSYDPATGVRGEENLLPSAIIYNGLGNITSNADGDLIYTNNQGVFKYHIGDENGTQLMNFVNSDLDITGFNAVIPLDDEHFIGVYSEYNEEQQGSVVKGGKFTRVDPKDVPDKAVMVLGGNYIPREIRRRAIEYNKKSSTHRIVLKDYRDYNSYDDYNAWLTQLNTDIVSGNMPDILIVNNYNMSLENYASKGVLADIGKLMEQDKELSGVEYMTNVFDACRINDTLYEIIPSFTVNTFGAKRSIVGDREGWTINEAQEVLKTMPAEASMFSDISQESFMSMVMEQCGRNFVDVSTGKCNFDSPEFIALMEFAKTLPTQEELNNNRENLETEDNWEAWYKKYQNQYRENRTLLAYCYLSNFTDLINTINGTFGEDVNFVGFPGTGGRGSVINANESYALSAKSANLDAAWDFMRYYLMEEYQSKLEWMLPVLKSQFEQNAQKATKKPVYNDEEGNQTEGEYYYWIGDEEIVIDPLTQKQVDDIKTFIASINKRSYYNRDVLNIITEETPSFFQGQKSAADVANVIQRRVQVFVNENR